MLFGLVSLLTARSIQLTTLIARSSAMVAFSSTHSVTGGNNSCTGTSFSVVQFPCLHDNYGYLLHDERTGETAAIDTPDGTAYQRELLNRGWKLSHILNTHHHADHTGGNLILKKATGAKVYGPASEAIAGVDVGLRAGDTVDFGGTKATVLDVGGHTRGHIAFYFASDATIFVGDSLFALGCGRMFEGTPEQFWTTLQRLRDLPDDTVVYCAHEYTASNAKFALSVEPNNVDLVERVKQIQTLRANGEPTVPSLLGVEKKTNPFLRCDLSSEIRRNVGVNESDSDAAAFAKVRRAKDMF